MVEDFDTYADRFGGVDAHQVRTTTATARELAPATDDPVVLGLARRTRFAVALAERLADAIESFDTQVGELNARVRRCPRLRDTLLRDYETLRADVDRAADETASALVRFSVDDVASLVAEGRLDPSDLVETESLGERLA